MTTTIPDLMNSISQVLTHAEELVAEGDSEQVGVMLTSFLKTLMADLDKLYVDQGSTGVRPQRRATNTNDSPNRLPPKPKRNIPNRYEGKCEMCDRHVAKQAGYVIPRGKPSGSGKKWHTYCTPCYHLLPKETNG